jgi:hypothetical protein
VHPVYAVRAVVFTLRCTGTSSLNVAVFGSAAELTVYGTH